MIKIPGFIDIQVNGFMGIDFSNSNLNEKTFISACEMLFERGTAGFLATVITSPAETYRRNLRIIAQTMRLPELRGRLLGIHAEGPFISAKPGAVGAHDPAWVKKPDIDFFKQMQDWAEGNIKLLTIAAENPGAEQLTEYASDNEVTVSLGHQLALSPDLNKCADAGAKLLTHLGNGLPNEINRHHNPIFSGIAEDRLTAMIITDGHHLPPALIKTFIRAKGADKIIVTSDASPIAGMPPGTYNVLGNLAVIEESGLLHNPEKKCLVGSSATMLACVNYLASLNLLSPEDLIKVSFTNPLKAINIAPDAIQSGREYAWNPEQNKFVSV
jgi:N-acetylglucosamine-6-phosphate deacetylase